MTSAPDSEDMAIIIPYVQNYNIEKDEWVFKNSLEEPCACATAEIVDNQIWLCNGCKLNKNEGNTCIKSLATVKQYKDCTDLWESMTNLSHSRFSAASATLGSCVFLFGGINSLTKKIETHMEVVIGESVKNLCLCPSKYCDENRVECCPFPFSDLGGVQAVSIPSLQSRLYQEFQCHVKSYSQN